MCEGNVSDVCVKLQKESGFLLNHHPAPHTDEMERNDPSGTGREVNRPGNPTMEETVLASMCPNL